jgi:hypothetical protein
VIIMDYRKSIFDEFQEDIGLTDEQLAVKCVHVDSIIEKEVAMSMYEGRRASEQSELKKAAASDLKEAMAEFDRVRNETLIKSGDSEAVRDAKTWELRPDLFAHYQKCQRILMEQ